MVNLLVKIIEIKMHINIKILDHIFLQLILMFILEMYEVMLLL